MNPANSTPAVLRIVFAITGLVMLAVFLLPVYVVIIHVMKQVNHLHTIAWLIAASLFVCVLVITAAIWIINTINNHKEF